jgi:SRSO17 transposase
MLTNSTNWIASAPGGRTFLDRRLYLPQEWCADEQRRREARVPAHVIFKTKTELAAEMLEYTWVQGVPMAWVTGDELYGDAPHVRDAIRRAGKRYVLAVSCHTPVWRERPPLEEPVAGGKGRPRSKPRLAAGAPAWQAVAAVIASQPLDSWQRLVVSGREKGPLTYDWTRVRIVESREGLPGPDGWLLARRSIADPTDIAYCLFNGQQSTSLQTMAEVASARWSIETAIEEGKGETGLDEYEVRYWHSWHRHVTLSMMAHAWLASISQGAGEKPGPGTGRTERPRGATTAGDRPAAPASFSGSAAGLVSLASSQTATGSPQSLSATRGSLARYRHS